LDLLGSLLKPPFSVPTTPAGVVKCGERVGTEGMDVLAESLKKFVLSEISAGSINISPLFFDQTKYSIQIQISSDLEDADCCSFTYNCPLLK
jgi:hypothetical protein